MKKFNKTIQVQVEVDAIAEKLLGCFKKEEGNAPLIVESVIGRMLHQDISGLSHLYSAMNGFKKDFSHLKIGKTYPIKDYSKYGYWNGDQRNSQKIENVEIVEINEYSDYPVKIRYEYPSDFKDGKPVMTKTTDNVDSSMFTINE